MQELYLGVVPYGLTPEEREGSEIVWREELNGDSFAANLSRAYWELWNCDDI